MSPPLVKDGHAPGGSKPDSGAKIDDWTQLSAHDSATDCERAKSEKALDLIAAFHESGKKDPLGEPSVAAALQALCVPSDYVYGVAPTDAAAGAASPARI